MDRWMEGGGKEWSGYFYKLALAYMLAELLTRRRLLPPTLTDSVSHTHMRTHLYIQDEGRLCGSVC